MFSIEYLAFFILVFVAVNVIVVVNGVRTRKNLRLRLNGSFGKPPAKTEPEFESISRYCEYKKSLGGNNMRIDDITWNDLDMDKVFARINSCLTSPGEEYLYERLHEPQFKPTALEEREKFIRFLEEHPHERLELQLCLARLGKQNYNGIPSLIFNPDGKSLKFTIVYKILSFVPLLSVVSMFFSLSAGALCLIISFIANLCAYYFAKQKIEAELPTIRYFSSILSCCGKLCGMKGLASEPFVVRLREKYEIFKHLKPAVSGMFGRLETETEIFLEYVRILFLNSIRNYNKAMRKITGNSEDFHELYRLLADIDTAVCVLSFRKSLPVSSNPIFHETNSIEFEEIYHPLLSAPVTNSGAITNNSIITGSNASGKSTFIKALAINGVLAQTIFTCAAKSFRMRFSLVITSMALRDDISEGDSYFIVEVKSIKRILDTVNAVACTCFIDEILRGTNTIERIAASSAVLRELAGKDCLCVVASHDIELTEILKDTYENYNFCEQVTDDGIVFDYKLKNGPSKTKNAIKLLRYMEFDKAIVENAEAMAAAFEAKSQNEKY